ncbi:plasmid mobilization protein [Roseinatronobacter bogoriensis]|uniref:Plasmid mobilization relaxosome protein MobC n=2 Tax=Roseinatronobacter bogoriensis TaxID=119542 RepID=A0A2K8K767_9RHOB|nr:MULTISPECIES: hypothetical protein [Rhodobaca]ATX65301.1 hypothetical protein BG454_05225 [Rhodobaca barguzinensis]MBB4209419.1 xylose isomerase [Rhodobaca bogoriensis DSM 18756]TDW34523.1 hypothetical protein LY39_03305 [Rhodobaca barguzinensis]TDY67159.1 hypothetical protein EV660_108162 [Rhodobaca bogoriensis DSM 18756]
MLKDRCIKVRVTSEEYEHFAAQAANAGVSLSAFLRNAGLRHRSRPSGDLLLRDLGALDRLATALQNLARVFANKQISASDMTTLLSVFRDMEIVLEKLNSESRSG